MARRHGARFDNRLYIELQRNGHGDERLLEAHSFSIWPIARACRWSRDQRCLFCIAADYEAHDALICIAEGRYVSEVIAAA